jgi:Na+-transporting NADH:ubiquinone oxidoreductase subunit C
MFSNRYIIIYSAVMVLIIAAALTVVAVQLKPRQEYNARVEKMQNILTSVNIESTPKNAEALYNKFVISSLVVNDQGDTVPGVDAFEVDLAKECNKEACQRSLPLFICQKEDSSLYYIVPARGKGLWGPIWGFIAFKEDLITLEGTMFGHKGETPGLGAEIDTREFQQQFIQKTPYDSSGKFVSIQVVKGGAPDDDLFAVDAISGGTITSKGLETMLAHCLKQYEKYFARIRK